MPLTLSGAGSFSLFKGPSLTATPLMSNKELLSIPSLSATVANASSKGEKTSSSLMNSVVPTERRARSVDAAMSRNRRGSNCSSRTSNKKPVWFKTFILRLQQTLFKFNNESGDQVDVGDDYLSSRSRSSVDVVRRVDENIGTSSCNRNINSDSLLLQRRKEGGLCENALSSTDCDNFILNDESSSLLSPSSPQRLSTSSIFEICAQTPRHKTKEPEVLRQVGRFTIVRESEDFDTMIFDQCHCLQKPCKYYSRGGTHPILSPKFMPESIAPSQTRDRNVAHRQQICLGSTDRLLHQHQPPNSRSPSLTSRSGPPGVHGYTFYSQPPLISSSSRHSLPCLHSNNYNNNLTNTSIVNKLTSSNTVPPASTIRTSKIIVSATHIPPTPCRKVLPTSASSPNLMNVNNQSKNENTWNNVKLRPLSHVSGGGPTLTTVRTKKSSIFNMHQDFISNKKHNSTPVVQTPSSSYYIPSPPKFTISSQEPHATISSHSGRKFEVELLYSSSVSSSSNSFSSSEFTSSSPASTSSVFSFASSPGTNSHSPTTTLNRQRSSTLSSKHGRKFEVTVLPSNNDATKNN